MNSKTVKNMIAKWHAVRSEDEEKFKKYFPDSDDRLAIVLRGHLLVENYLDRLNRHCFHYPEYYDEANLQFNKKLLIAKAQVLVPHENPDSFFDGIMKLNELRNSLAHDLDSPKLNQRITAFLETIEKEYSHELVAVRTIEHSSIEMRLSSAICFILGQMSILDNVIEFMEKSRSYGAGNNDAEAIASNNEK